MENNVFYKRELIPDCNKIEPNKLNDDGLKAFIDMYPWYQSFDFGNGITVKGTHNSMEDIDKVLIEDMKGMRYLDIGSNQGFQVLSAAMRGAAAYGIDNKIKQITMAKIIAKYFGIKADFTLIDVFDAKHKYIQYHNGFDYISMMSVFHHFKKPKEALRIVRGMSNGVMMGEFCIYTDDNKNKWSKADKFPEDWKKEYHKTFPTIDCIVNELKAVYSRVEVIGPLKVAHRILIKSTV